MSTIIVVGWRCVDCGYTGPGLEVTPGGRAMCLDALACLDRQVPDSHEPAPGEV